MLSLLTVYPPPPKSEWCIYSLELPLVYCIFFVILSDQSTCSHISFPAAL
uniref:Uncharacterized protein n=1 Tax=Anguilla anguilla TaxID=7936 RepID=A0A0E9V216_ANGAN